VATILANNGFRGPSSGLTVLSQASELLDKGETIHQQIHISEFQFSEKVANRLSKELPPKEVADKYIEGKASSLIIGDSPLERLITLPSVLCQYAISTFPSQQFSVWSW
jgi:hypothetical protein